MVPSGAAGAVKERAGAYVNPSRSNVAQNTQDTR